MDILDLNKKVLKVLAVWPSNDEITVGFLKWTFLAILSTVYVSVPVAGGMTMQLINGIEDVSIIFDDTVALTDNLLYVYVIICFLLNFDEIKEATSFVTGFQKFCPIEIINDAENEVRRFTKGVLIYALTGLCVNSAVPLINKKHCPMRPSQILQERDPCGLIIRSYFPVDVSNSPAFEVAYAGQVYCTAIVAITVLCVTLYVLGLLMHLMAQLRNCRKLIVTVLNSNNEEISTSEIEDRMNFCVQYHIAIVQFSFKTTNAFSSMMLSYLTMTSIAISALGYRIITDPGSHDTLRFIMHLGGWLILLFFTCFYGQKLIDESSALAIDVYDTMWYNCSIPVQKSLILLIMRAQNPLQLSAASLGIMSYATFLQVLKTAYSYLTLLLAVTN